jgi:hypothetical protein
VFGLSLVACALLLYASDTVMSSVWIGGLVRVLFGAGMGFVAAPATESIMGSLPKEKAGVGSAMNDTTRQTGGALGVAVLGSIFAFQYHRVIGKTAGVPSAALHEARDSIGRSLQAAKQLGGGAGAHLTAAAQHAFVSSMHITFGVAAVVVMFAAFVAARFLPPHELESDAAASLRSERAESLAIGVEAST